MTVDVSTLGIVVKSDGVAQAKTSLDNLATSADNAERKVSSLTSTLSSLTSKQKAALSGVSETTSTATSRIESFLKKLQAQVDLFGANNEKMATYKASAMNSTEAQVQMAKSLGAQVDSLKAAATATKELTEAQKKIDAAHTAAIIEDMSRAWKMLGVAQAEAIAMNKAYDAAEKKLQGSHVAAIIEDKARAYKQLAAAQAEALAMNKAFDARKAAEAEFLSSLKLRADSFGKNNEQLNILRATQAGYSAETVKLAGEHGKALDKLQAMEAAAKSNTKAIQTHTFAMQDAHDAARGLSGGLGALWLTYGNIAPMVAGVALAASMKQIVSIGKDVENTLEGIRVKGQETAESVTALREVVTSLGKGVYGPQEVTKALETLILAGLNAKEAALGINAALNLATVGGTSIEKASYALVQVGTALGYSAAGYDRIADVIAATAAASMSSVESISESFKAGSAVGKLYGATLSDLGTEFALLSNLGIKGTAAGTAVKNFYSVLLGDNKKAVDALKSIGLAAKDFKDSEGYVLSFTEIMSKLAAGLDKYKKSSQDLILANTSNERGLKVMVEGMDAVRTSGETAASKLEELFKRIDEAYGFAAQGAAAMALTVDAQFKSVKNSLETEFLKAFQDIQPQISVVARALKDAFKSQEFTKGIQSIALAIADLTVFLVDNASAIGKVLEAFLAWKAITFIGGLLVSIAQGLVAVEKALAAGRIAAIAFQVSFGLVVAALLAAGAALTWWMTKKEEATTSPQSRATLTYLDDFNKKLDEENERLTKQINLIAEGKTRREAETQAMIDQQRHMIELKRLEAGKEERDNYNKLRGGLSASEQALLDKANGKQLNPDASVSPEWQKAVANVNAVIKAKEALNGVEDQANKIAEASNKTLEKNIELSKTYAVYADWQAKNERKTGGTEDVKKALTTAEINAKWKTDLAKINGEIEAFRDNAKYAVNEYESLYKQGVIGDLTLIEARKKSELSAQDEIIAKLQQKLSLTSPKNKDPEVERMRNDLEKANRDKVEISAKAERDIAEYLEKSEQRKTQATIAGYKARGEYVKAFEAENAVQYGLDAERFKQNIQFEMDQYEKAAAVITDPNATPEMLEQASKDALTAANLISVLNKNLEELTKRQESGKFAAGIKEMDFAAQAMLRDLQAGVAEIQAQTTDGSIINTLFKSDQLDALYQTKLPLVKAELDAIEQQIAQARAEGKEVSEEDKKNLATRKRDYEVLVKHQRDVYKDFITEVDQIGSEGFRASFDKTEGSWDGYLKKMKNSFKTILIDEIYKMLARPFVLNILANITGAAGMSGLSGSLSNAANAGSSLFNLAGTANNTYGMFNTGSMVTGGYGALPGTTSIANASGAIGGDTLGTFIDMNPQWTADAGSTALSFSSLPSFGTALENVGTAVSTFSTLLESGTGVIDAASAALAGAGASFAAVLGPIGLGIALLVSSGIFSSNGAPKTNLWGVFNGSASGLDILHGDDRHGTTAGGETLAQAVYTDSVKAIVAKYAPNTTYTGFIGSQINNKGHSSNQDFAYVSTTGLSSIAGTSGDIYNNHNPDSGKGMEDFQKWVVEEVPRLQLAIITDAFRKAGGGVKEIADSLMGTATDLTKTLDAMSGADASSMITQLNELVTVYQTLHDTINPQITGAATVALVKLAGGVQNLTTSVDAYYNGYFSEAERMEKLSTKLTEQFKEMNLTVPTTREQFRKLVEGLDTSTASGQQAFIKLMGLASSFGTLADYTASLNSAVTTAVEDFSEAIKTATETQNTLLSKYASSHQKYVDALKTLEDGFKALNLAVPTSAAEFYNIVKGADKATVSGRALITALNQMAPAFDTVLEATKNRIQGRVDSANAGVEAAYNALQRAVDAEKAKVDAAYQKQVDAVGVAFKAAQDAAETQIKAANDTKSAITSLASTLNSAVKSVGTDINVLSLVQRSEAIKALETAAKAGSTGNSLLPYSQSITDAIETLSKPSEDLYSDFVSYSRDQHKANNVLTSLNDSASAQKSVAELTLDALTAAKDQAQVNNDALLKTLSDNHETQIKDLDDQITAAKTMIDVMNGVDVSVKSVADAVRALAAAMAIAKSANAAAGVGAVQNLSGMSTQDIIDRGTSLGQSSSEISSVVKAVDQINTLQNTDLYWAAKQGATLTAQQLASQLAPGWNPTSDQLAYWNNQIATQGGAQAVAQFLNPTDPNAARNKYLTNSHATGLERVPYDNYPAWLHEGEAVVDANSVKAIERYFGVDVSKAPSTVNNANSRNASEYSELCNEVKQLRAEQQAALIAIAQSSGRTAKQLERWDGDGIPDTRVV